MSAYTGPRPFPVTTPSPVNALVDVQAHHELDCVQLVISHPAGHTIVFIPNEAARKVAHDILDAAGGIVLARLDDSARCKFSPCAPAQCRAAGCEAIPPGPVKP